MEYAKRDELRDGATRADARPSKASSQPTQADDELEAGGTAFSGRAFFKNSHFPSDL